MYVGPDPSSSGVEGGAWPDAFVPGVPPVAAMTEKGGNAETTATPSSTPTSPTSSSSPFPSLPSFPDLSDLRPPSFDLPDLTNLVNSTNNANNNNLATSLPVQLITQLQRNVQSLPLGLGLLALEQDMEMEVDSSTSTSTGWRMTTRVRWGAGPLGEWEICARGHVEPALSSTTSESRVRYEEVGVQPAFLPAGIVELIRGNAPSTSSDDDDNDETSTSSGSTSRRSSWPAVSVPVAEPLGSVAWRTTYVGEEHRVERCGGYVFLFRRSGGAVAVAEEMEGEGQGGSTPRPGGWRRVEPALDS